MTNKKYVRGTWGSSEELTLTEYVKGEVYSSGCYSEGQLEALQSKLEKLNELFGDMLRALPKKTSNRLAQIWGLEQLEDS